MVNNTICNDGIGIYCYGNTKPVFYNNIIWGNDIQVYIGSAESQPDFFYCDIQGDSGSFSGSYPFTGNYENNLDLDPQFLSPSAGSGSINFDPDADWSLQVISPCLNSGTPDISGLNLYPSDILGNPRILYNRIDQGAIEYHMDTITVCGSVSTDTIWFTDTIKVDCDLTIEDNKVLTILPGTVIKFQGYYKINVQGTIIAEGTEYDTILFTIKDTTGFNNPEITNGGWGSIEFDNNSGSMSDNDSSVFRFCKFQYGKAVIAGHPGEYGGAIKSLQFSRIRIENCSFINNVSESSGGAVYFWLSDLILRNNYFENNTSGMGGGALSFYLGSHAEIDHNVFYRNHTRQYYNGGAIYLVGSGIVIENNIFSNNTASEGGAINIFQSENGLIINNLICNNTAIYNGGGIKYEMTTEFYFVNNTIVNNQSITGGGLDIQNGNPIIYNSQIWGNQPNQINIGDLKGQPDIFYSNIQGGTEEFSGVDFLGNYSNNINSEPYFALPSQGAGIEYEGLEADWSLLAVSPCINSGTTDIPGVTFPEFDLYGNSRIHPTGIDIGALENQSGPPVITEQPLNFVKCVGDHIVFTVKTSEEAFFQWQKDEINIEDATGNQYMIDSLTPGHEGNYQCLISNAYDTLKSNPVFLGVKIPPEILSQIKNLWTEKDQPSSLKVFADGTNLKYQWQQDGVDIPEGVTPEFVISNTDFDDEGEYICIINNSCNADTTASIRLFVTPQICMVTVDPLTGHNLVIWEKESKAPLVAYNVYRESKASGIYDLMGTVASENLSILADTTADPTVQAYIYKITGIDTSGYETDIDLCTPHKTIHLLVSTNPELNTTQLEWDKYYGFEYQTYNILRSATGTNFAEVHSIASSLASWTDPDPLPEVGYYRIAVEKPLPWCMPTGGSKKAESGPYSHSMSNIEDNRLQEIYENQAPTDMNLTNNTIAENQSIGTLVGRLTTTDADTTDHHTYKLVSGYGDIDNNRFTTLGDLLITAEILDYEVKDTLSVRIKSTDKGDLSVEESFIILVTDVNEGVGNLAPMDITLSFNSIDENKPVGTLIGKFQTTDPNEEDMHTYGLVEGLGGDDNNSFIMLGDALLSGEQFDFETKGEFTIRVQSRDDGDGRLSFQKSFTIYINDLLETEITDSRIENNVFDIYPNPFSDMTVIRFKNPTGEKYSMFITDLTGKVVYFEDHIFTDLIEFTRDKIPDGYYFIELRGAKIYRGIFVIE